MKTALQAPHWRLRHTWLLRFWRRLLITLVLAPQYRQTIPTCCHDAVIKASVYLLDPGYKNDPFGAVCQFLADCAGLADSFQSVASLFDGHDLFVKELETVKRATKFLGTQNLPHN